jgi:hypothetical protein
MEKNKAVYERFLVYQKFVEDTYWKDIFYSCACNKFPKGVRYYHSKSTISVRSELVKNKPKTDVFSLSENDQSAFETMMHIFKNLLNLSSESDVKSKIDDLESLRKKSDVNLEVEWKKLKPRPMKNQILMNFATSQIKEYSLDVKDVKYLYYTIQLGLQFKTLSDTDIHYSKGVVTQIDGLVFDKKQNTFIITNPSKPIAKTDKTVVKTNKLFQCVDKWAKDYSLNYII